MVKPKAAAKKPAKKAKNGYQMPSHLPLNSIIQDIAKKSWKIGPSIGSGGFGEIYSACKADDVIKKVENYPFVVKIVSSFDSIRCFKQKNHEYHLFLGASPKWSIIC